MTEKPFAAVNGCIFPTYPCKFEERCKRTGKYNPAQTILVTIKSITGSPKVIQKLNCCTHGGGSCAMKRFGNKRELNWPKEPDRRVIS